MAGINQDFKNTREYKRYHKELKVSLINNPSIFHTENISKGGFFLKIEKPLELDSEHQFKIEIDSRLYEFAARVIWIRSDFEKYLPIGSGMKFIDATPKFYSDLGGYLVEIDLTQHPRF